MNKELYELLNSAGEIRIEIGGPDKYHYMTNEEIIMLLDAMEAMETLIEWEQMARMQRKAA
jgi:hypothetical protein